MCRPFSGITLVTNTRGFCIFDPNRNYTTIAVRLIHLLGV
jgi:hypothetical protein